MVNSHRKYSPAVYDFTRLETQNTSDVIQVVTLNSKPNI